MRKFIITAFWPRPSPHLPWRNRRLRPDGAKGGRSPRGIPAPDILPGGIVMPLYPAGSPFLNAKRVSEAENTHGPGGAGTVSRIVNIHNPSIEVHLAGAGNKPAPPSSCAGRRSLHAGDRAGGADPVPFFFQYGINTIILRNRLRSDGYEPRPTASTICNRPSHGAGHAAEWHIDPHKIGAMVFRRCRTDHGHGHPVSGVQFQECGDALGNVSARPDFVGSLSGPSLFTPAWTSKNGVPPIPKDAPPSFIAGAAGRTSACRVGVEYFAAMLNAGIPNVEMQHLCPRHPRQWPAISRLHRRRHLAGPLCPLAADLASSPSPARRPCGQGFAAFVIAPPAK